MINDSHDRNTRSISYINGSISDDGYVYDINTGDEEITTTVSIGSLDSQRAKSSELVTQTKTETKENRTEKEKED